MPRLTRRAFMESTAAVAASGALAPSTSVAAPRAGRTLTLGVASYSTRKFTLDQTLEMAKTLGVTSMTFKDVHIPRTDSPDATRALRAKIEAAGITIMGGGTITLPNDPVEIRKNFEYAKAAGFPLIFTSPDPAALDTIERMAKSTTSRSPSTTTAPRTSGGRARRTPTRPSSRATAAWACASTSATRCGPAPIQWRRAGNARTACTTCT